ncbi:MAG TPA: DUF748 domain-containing protein [Burkholderiaceae bacterium]|nr:DUF748 domain-containing protein [Burkholderiaceae bacterium]
MQPPASAPESGASSGLRSAWSALPRPSIPARRTLAWTAGILVALALIYQLVLGYWVPRWALPHAQATGEVELGAPLKIEHIEISPWRMEARLYGVVLGPAQQPWFAIRELRANASIESLLRFAPVLEALEVDELRAHLERHADGQLNIAPMLERIAKRRAERAAQPPLQFAVHNVRIVDSDIELVDDPSKHTHRVQKLNVGIPFISNLPSKVQVVVNPSLQALVNGAPLKIEGNATPFAQGHRSEINVDWRDIDVPQWLDALAPLLDTGLPVQARDTRLAAQLKLLFETRADTNPLLQVTGAAQLSKGEVRMAQTGASLEWQSLALQGIDVAPLDRRAGLASVALQGPVIGVDLAKALAPARDRDSHAAKSHATPASASGASAPAQPAPWQWRVGEFIATGGEVRLMHPAWKAPQVATGLRVEVRDLDARKDAPPGTVKLALSDANGAALSIDGSAQPFAPEAQAHLTLRGFNPAPWLAPWGSSLPVRLVDAQVEVDAQAHYTSDEWSLEAQHAQIKPLKLVPAAVPAPAAAASRPVAARAARGRPAESTPVAEDRLSIADLQIEGLAVHGDAQGLGKTSLRRLAFEGLSLRATRARDRSFAWLGSKPVAASSGSAKGGAAAQEPGRPGATTAPKPLDLQIGEIECGGCEIGLLDQSVTPALPMSIEKLQLKLRNVSTDGTRPIGFSVSGVGQHSGPVQATGEVRTKPLALDSKLSVAAMDLRAFQSYLEPWLNVAIASAKLNIEGNVDVRGDASQAMTSAHYRGKLGLSDVRLRDSINDTDFIRMKTLGLDATDVAWKNGVTADLGDISLRDFYGRVIINPNGQVNLRDIVKSREGAAARSITTPESQEDTVAASAREEQEEMAEREAQEEAERARARAAGAPAAASAPAASAAPAKAAEPARIRWRGIKLAGGRVDFTDNFVRPNYSARLTDVEGTVSALAWNDPKPAQVSISGKVDGDAPLSITGSMHPLGPRLYTDVFGEARGIELTRLSTYAARYAGYGIEKGTLSVKVHYKVENGQLRAENNLYLDQLTFGDKVDSPSALKLPVQLAVSLLKDRNGVIDVNLPVSGSLDDPKFSIGGVIVRVIVNLIAKAVTAPFALLGSAFSGSGAGGEHPGMVAFSPGSEDISDEERKKLDSLIKALEDRPNVRLEATGHADPNVDAEGLRNAGVERQMRAAKARALGVSPAGLQIEDSEREKWLEAAYKAADIKKPRNFVGIAKAQTPEEMEALLKQSVQAGDEQLRTLANHRADKVKAYLTAKLPPERVLLTASKLEGKDTAPSVTFALK